MAEMCRDWTPVSQAWRDEESGVWRSASWVDGHWVDDMTAADIGLCEPELLHYWALPRG